MYIIYIDTATRNNNIIEVRNEKGEKIDSVIGEFDLVSSLEFLLRKNNITYKDVKEFVPNLGPGSFTGLKNGITVCNVLNWSLGKKVISEMYVPEYGAEPNIQR